MQTRRSDNHGWRKFKSALASVVAFVSAVLVITPLALVFFHLVVNGASSVNWDFFTKLPAPVGAIGGGMANAIVGSLELLALAGAIGIPIGVLGGVYLAENQKRAGIGYRIYFGRARDNASWAGIFSSSHQRREFSELGFFHEITSAGRSGWRRHGECNPRLA